MTFFPGNFCIHVPQITPLIEVDGLPLSCHCVNDQLNQLFIAALAGREPISNVGNNYGR
ncbi:hypothetical protein NKH49_30235 [Mesorhizobium sp. M1088]|uniref:hypothetical protein n=1 Tax=Mesorhizobium sp. M1088 TaxID=2957056 RepID=UPI003339497E